MPQKLDELNKKIEKAISIIKQQYMAADGNLPWLIGYSGGKDSTCTSQLVFRAIKELGEEGFELARRVVIFSSDTMIENPLVKVIIEKNIELINTYANKYNLPIKAHILSPSIENTFWVNVIGRGYPTPNTMFRWCTDRMKIMPANTFIKKYIDETGEVIMVLGVRQGESNTRDRVLKTHEIKGEVLTRHTTLSNAYVFAPIRFFDTVDVFLYLSEMPSPWGSNNKELYFFYEESGGGDCPIFVSMQDKTSSNSCGNSRMGCWCCTVVTNDKSLTGFLETGWHDELKPLLEFRNWLVSIRDNEDYRCFYRMNGSVYTKKLEVKESDNGKQLIIKGKGIKKKSTFLQLDENGCIPEDSSYQLIEKNKLTDFMKKEKISFKDPIMARIILFDSVTGEYFKIGTGPFNENAKREIFYKLIETEYKYNQLIDDRVNLITDEEVEEIKKAWLRSSMDIRYIDEIMAKFGRNIVEIVQDSFELMNQKYEKQLKTILYENDLDLEVLSNLIQEERKHIGANKKEEMQDIIASVFESDRVNYQS